MRYIGFMGEGHFGAADSAVDNWAPCRFVEREPVPTRVLNPNASEASYKPKQRSYRNVLN